MYLIKIMKAVEIWHEEYISIFNHLLGIHFALFISHHFSTVCTNTEIRKKSILEFHLQ